VLHLCFISVSFMFHFNCTRALKETDVIVSILRYVEQDRGVHSYTAGRSLLPWQTGGGGNEIMHKLEIGGGKEYFAQISVGPRR